jgi:hypothetical protein
MQSIDSKSDEIRLTEIPILLKSKNSYVHTIEGLLNQIDIIFIAELVETLWFAMNPDEAAITNLAGAVFL